MSQDVDSINLLRRATHPKLDKGLYFKDLQKPFRFSWKILPQKFIMSWKTDKKIAFCKTWKVYEKKCFILHI